MKDIKQIWIKDANKENTWVCFRKKFFWNNGSETVAKIATDTKYWLYLNGKIVVREGGLKRGPGKNASYFDEVDLREYLVNGENTLAILVCYFGRSGFSHVSSGVGGLRLSLGQLQTDETWKAILHPAYVEADPNDEPTNFRLAESNIYFDASKDIPGWEGIDYDDSTWQQAYVCTTKEAECWGNFVKRITPQLKDYGLTVVKTNEKTIRLPYNAQFSPYIKVDAPKACKIFIKTDNYDTGMYGEKTSSAVYYTREGVQEYESLGWLNGEWIILETEGDVKILEIGYRETGYDTKVVKTFSSQDPFLNKLWDKCVRTLLVTMRDTFMDCPDRERVQWWGDVTNEMEEAHFCLDDKAMLLYKKGVQSLAGWAVDGAHMMTVVPSGTEQFELPMQNLAGIVGFDNYFFYTRDIEVPRMAYRMSVDYLKLYEMGPDGCVVHRTGSWDWPDWGEHADVTVMENAWYFKALGACKSMARLLRGDILGEEEYKNDIAFLNERWGSIFTNYKKKFYKNGCFYDYTDNGVPDDRANALAVLSGLGTEDTYEGVRKILTSVENSSPYMEKYVLEALCMMGYVDDAYDRIKRRYKDMVDEDYSTLWEYWNKDGTKNHAWSGGPLIIMSKYPTKNV